MDGGLYKSVKWIRKKFTLYEIACLLGDGVPLMSFKFEITHLDSVHDICGCIAWTAASLKRNLTR